MTIKIIRNDITKTNVEAIVCPSNTRLLEGSGTSYRIYKAAGESLLNKACQEIGGCELTKSVITSGFNLCKYIIHVVGPIYDIGMENEENLLYQTYENAFISAEEKGVKTLAVPLLSSGNYGFPKDISLHIAIDAASKFSLKSDMEIQIVVYDLESVRCAKRIMPVEELIDDDYVQATNEDFADEDFIRRFRRERRSYNIRPTLSHSLFEEAKSEECTVFLTEKASKKSIKKKRSLEDLMKLKNETFSEMLLRLIDQKGMSDSETYHRANISKQHFNKIKNVKGYTPKKPTIFSLAMALELSLDETIDLLAKAGQAFSDCSKTDIIVKYFIENKDYDLYELNQTLNNYHLEPLCL